MQNPSTIDLDAFRRFAARLPVVEPVTVAADEVQPQQFPPFPTEPIWLKR